MTDAELIEEHGSMVAAISPLMANHDPIVQGAVLADLLSMWLAGHPSQERVSLLAMHIKMTQRLIDVNEAALFGGNGHPGNVARDRQ